MDQEYNTEREFVLVWTAQDPELRINLVRVITAIHGQVGLHSHNVQLLVDLENRKGPENVMEANVKDLTLKRNPVLI